VRPGAAARPPRPGQCTDRRALSRLIACQPRCATSCRRRPAIAEAALAHPRPHPLCSFFNGIFQPDPSVVTNSTYMPTGAQVNSPRHAAARRTCLSILHLAHHPLAPIPWVKQRTARCTGRSAPHLLASSSGHVRHMPAMRSPVAQAPLPPLLQVVPIYTQADVDDILIRAYTKCNTYQVSRLHAHHSRGPWPHRPRRPLHTLAPRSAVLCPAGPQSPPVPSCAGPAELLLRIARVQSQGQRHGGAAR
jgi:hypothetical protein